MTTNILIILSFMSILLMSYFILKTLKGEKSAPFNTDLEKLKLEVDLKNEKIGELQAEIENVKKEKNELQGRGKETYSQLLATQEKNKTLQDRIEKLTKEATKTEAEKERKEKEFGKQVSDLEKAREALEDEKQRIRREDEERLAQEEAERDRVWNEHEQMSIASLKETCQKPDISFSFYENTNLPDSFTGRFKPDFLVEFLGKYIIFDAKMSRSASLQNYLREQVKKTAEKIKNATNKEEIYPIVFFVVPNIAISDLKTTTFYEDGYQFYIISIEAFEPVLHCFKRITHYELMENMDPKERENIVQLIAAYDYHISWQNTLNILSAAHGVKVLNEKEKLPAKILNDIEITKSKMRMESLKISDIKRLTSSPEDQIKEIRKFVEPQKPLLNEKDLKEIE